MADAEHLSFASRRSPVLGRRGMVATSQPLAVQAGLEMLARGGRAADAAVAAAAALNVTEPTSTGIGGDCFALHFASESGQVTALNGSGRAPRALTIDVLRRENLTPLPPFHAHTITVPGAVAAWCDLAQRHGMLPLSTVLAPAIRMADQGFPVAPITAYFWERGAQRQLRQAANGHELLVDGRAPRAGEMFRNPGLARALRAIAEGGAAAYYRGEIGRAIVAAVHQAGGVLAESDLEDHHSTWEEPISTSYRGLRIWECPPNGQGIVALIALNILEGFPVSDMPGLSARRLHLVAESLRLAFSDAFRHVGDPAFGRIPVEDLLSPSHAAERRKRIRPDRTRRVTPGRLRASSDTVYLSVVDGQGNACSLINSNYMGFGTGIVPAGWGFTLQNRGHNFSLDPGHPNALLPGKRPFHTIIPALATRGDGSLYASFGVMGGFMQPQGHVQVVLGLLDDALDPQQALDRPRLCVSQALNPSVLSLEEGIPARTARRLAAMGHRVEIVRGAERALFGRGQIILRDAESGVLWGGSDGRADGCAAALA